jgi:hypothetical protein
MGATLGVTIMGTIVNAGLPRGARRGDGVALHRLPPGLREGLAAALQPAFVAATCVGALVWLIALLGVKEVALRRSVDDVATAEAAAGAPDPGPNPGALDSLR